MTPDLHANLERIAQDIEWMEKDLAFVKQKRHDVVQRLVALDTAKPMFDMIAARLDELERCERYLRHDIGILIEKSVPLDRSEK